MTRSLTMLPALLILLTAGCEKDGETVTPDGTTATGDTGDTGEPSEPEDPVVPQDPDPPELAQARAQLVLGNMDAVKEATEPLMTSLSAPSQARANGIASALFAIAVAEEIAENAKEPADNAIAKGEEVRDAEVRQLAHIALGAHLVGVGDAASAQAELEKARALDAPNRDLVLLYLAQSILNQAFDESDKLTNPEKLDEAVGVYQEAIESSSDAAIKGRGSAGLAALAKYRGKKDDICTHAAAASEHYAAAGASTYLTDVPSLLAGDAKCK